MRYKRGEYIGLHGQPDQCDGVAKFMVMTHITQPMHRTQHDGELPSSVLVLE